MLRENKWKLLISSLVTLLPIGIGMILWNQLPDQMPVHFNFEGTADDWADKLFVILGLPGILLGGHLFCILAMAIDPKGKNIGKKPIGFLFWLIPCVSLVMNCAIFANALNLHINIATICILILGLLYIVMGNILPKVQQNYSFGIKVSWALDDSQNWTATHRVGGWSLVIGGVVILATAFWPNLWILLATVILSSLIPVAYSFFYYKRHRKEDR